VIGFRIVTRCRKEKSLQGGSTRGHTIWGGSSQSIRGSLDVVTFITILRSFLFLRKFCPHIMFSFFVLFSSYREKRNHDWKKTSLNGVLFPHTTQTCLSRWNIPDIFLMSEVDLLPLFQWSSNFASGGFRTSWHVTTYNPTWSCRFWRRSLRLVILRNTIPRRFNIHLRGKTSPRAWLLTRKAVRRTLRSDSHSDMCTSFFPTRMGNYHYSTMMRYNYATVR
jgi:hypothetical protein